MSIILFIPIAALVTSDFSRSNGEWTGEEDKLALPVKHDPINKLISITPDPSGNLQGAYFVAPGWHWFNHQLALIVKKLDLLNLSFDDQLVNLV